MPDTIANPYNFQSPIGASLKKLGAAITSGPSEAQQLYLAEKALAAKRENENLTGLGDVFQQYGKPGFDRGRAMNMAIRGGMNPDHLGGYERYGAANTYGAADPRTTNAFVGAGGAFGSTAHGFREGQATEMRKHGMTQDTERWKFENTPETYVNPQTNQPMIGTRHGAVGQRPVLSETDEKGFRLGQNFGNVGDLPQAERRILGGYDTEGNKPYEYVNPETGQPMVGTQRGAVGQRPILSETDSKGYRLDQNFGNVGALPPAERRILGAEPTSTSRPTPRMYMDPAGQRHVTYDGVTSAQTGHPLPQGGSLMSVQGTPEQAGLRPNVQGQLQQSDIAHQRLGALSNYARSLLSPQNVGATGMVKGWAQDATQLAANLAQGLGYTGLNEAITDMQRRAQASGVDPNTVSGLFTFDPSLPKVDTAYHMLVLSAADALAGGMGKASDRDIRIVKSIVGDPGSLFASPMQLNAKLDALNEILMLNQGVTNQNLRPGAPASAAPAARIRIDAQGKVIP